MDEKQYAEEYRRGFNEGYLIARHMPKLVSSLSKVNNDVPRVQGLRGGFAQYTDEKRQKRNQKFGQTKIIGRRRNPLSGNDDKKTDRDR